MQSGTLDGKNADEMSVRPDQPDQLVGLPVDPAPYPYSAELPDARMLNPMAFLPYPTMLVPYAFPQKIYSALPPEAFSFPATSPTLLMADSPLSESSSTATIMPLVTHNTFSEPVFTPEPAITSAPYTPADYIKTLQENIKNASATRDKAVALAAQRRAELEDRKQAILKEKKAHDTLLQTIAQAQETRSVTKKEIEKFNELRLAADNFNLGLMHKQRVLLAQRMNLQTALEVARQDAQNNERRAAESKQYLATIQAQTDADKRAIDRHLAAIWQEALIARQNSFRRKQHMLQGMQAITHDTSTPAKNTQVESVKKQLLLDPLISALKSEKLDIPFIDKCIKEHHDMIARNPEYIRNALEELKSRITQYRIKIALYKKQYSYIAQYSLTLSKLPELQSLIASASKALENCKIAYQKMPSLLSHEQQSSFAEGLAMNDDDINEFMNAIENIDMQSIQNHAHVLDQIKQENTSIIIEFIDIMISELKIEECERNVAIAEQMMKEFTEFEKNPAEKTGEQLYRYTLKLRHMFPNISTNLIPSDLTIFEIPLKEMIAKAQAPLKAAKYKLACFIQMKTKIHSGSITFSSPTVTLENQTPEKKVDSLAMLKSIALRGNNIDYKEYVTSEWQAPFITSIYETQVNARLEHQSISNKLKELTQQLADKLQPQVCAEKETSESLIIELKKIFHDCNESFHFNFEAKTHLNKNKEDLFVRLGIMQSAMETWLESNSTLMRTCDTLLAQYQHNVSPMQKTGLPKAKATASLSCFLKLRKAIYNGDSKTVNANIASVDISDEAMAIFKQIISDNIAYFSTAKNKDQRQLNNYQTIKQCLDNYTMKKSQKISPTLTTIPPRLSTFAPSPDKQGITQPKKTKKIGHIIN